MLRSTYFALAAMLMMGLAQADELAEQGRAVFEANKDAVITVKGVISVNYGGEEQERESWANGVVLAADGLTVLSLTFVDPFYLSETMGRQDFQATSKVVSLQMITGPLTEIPAEVVLRDKDLDLVFVRPTEKLETPFAHVDLGNPGAPKLLDQVAVLVQLGEVARRAHSIFVDRIETLVEKPRTYYALGDHRARALVSAPVFTLDNKFVGLGAMRAIKQGQQGGMGDNVMVVVVPARDIAEAVEQAPAWEAGESSEAAPPAPSEAPPTETPAAGQAPGTI